MKFAIFAGNGVYWGVVKADNDYEAIETAAREWGTEGYTKELEAFVINDGQEAALDEWASAGQPADSMPLEQ